MAEKEGANAKSHISLGFSRIGKKSKEKISSLTDFERREQTEIKILNVSTIREKKKTSYIYINR